MANKGKPWLPEHDAYLSENIDASNEQLAENLGRSVWGVECRRVSLALALNEKDPSRDIDDCISHFRANVEQTKRRLEQQGSGSNNNKRVKKKTSEQGLDEADIIAQISECIRVNKGNMSAAWANVKFVPIIIKNHSGFQAYASFLRDK